MSAPNSWRHTRRSLPGDKASVLVEALPYIRRFWGKVVVVKYGGNVLAPAPDGTGVDDAGALASFAEDVVLMRSVGMLPVVVHGGGPQIGALMERVGKESEFLDGLRVTDAETIDLVRMVLVGKVNRDIVSSINVHGALAVGLSGEDANLITATHAVGSARLRRRRSERRPDHRPRASRPGADPGGRDHRHRSHRAGLQHQRGHGGRCACRRTRGGEAGLLDRRGRPARRCPSDPATLIHRATADELEAMVTNGAATGGMIPKVQACARAVRGGVGHAHILDGRTPHALLLEVFTDEGIGTMVGVEG